MGTIVAVKKGSQVTIAADCCNVLDAAMRTRLNISHGCILRVADSFIGINSSLAVQQAFEEAIASMINTPGSRLGNRDEIRQFFLRIHEYLKNRHGLYVHYQQGQEFEWTPMNALVANASGIYKVDSSRAVYEFTKYWALGSGEAYALGAMAAVYDRLSAASEIAQVALSAVQQIEVNTDREPELLSIETKRIISAAPAVREVPIREHKKVTQLPPRSRKPRNRSR